MPDNKGFSGKMDRRIVLQRPVSGRAGANERMTAYENVISNLSAHKVENQNNGSDGLENNSKKSSEIITEWQVRFLIGIKPLATWRLIDEYGDTYDIIALPTEIGRRKGLSIKTRFVS